MLTFLFLFPRDCLNRYLILKLPLWKLSWISLVWWPCFLNLCKNKTKQNKPEAIRSINSEQWGYAVCDVRTEETIPQHVDSNLASPWSCWAVSDAALGQGFQIFSRPDTFRNCAEALDSLPGEVPLQMHSTDNFRKSSQTPQSPVKSLWIRWTPRTFSTFWPENCWSYVAFSPYTNLASRQGAEGKGRVQESDQKNRDMNENEAGIVNSLQWA